MCIAVFLRVWYEYVCARECSTVSPLEPLSTVSPCFLLVSNARPYHTWYEVSQCIVRVHYYCCATKQETSGRCVPQLAKMSIGPSFIELASDAFRIIFMKNALLSVPTRIVTRTALATLPEKTEFSEKWERSLK